MTKYTHINAEHNIVVANNILYKIEADFSVSRLNVLVQGEILQLESISFDVEGMDETNKGLFILTTEGLFKLRDGKVEAIDTPHKFTKLVIAEETIYGYIGKDSIYNFTKSKIIKTPCNIKKALLTYCDMVLLLEDRTLFNMEHPANGRIIDCLQHGKLVTLTSDGEVYFGNEKIAVDERIESISSQYIGTGYRSLMLASKSKLYCEQIDILGPNNPLPREFIEMDITDSVLEFIEVSAGCRYVVNNEIRGTLRDSKSYFNDSGVVDSSFHFEVDRDRGRDLILHRDGTVYYINMTLLNKVLNVGERPEAEMNPLKVLPQGIEV